MLAVAQPRAVTRGVAHRQGHDGCAEAIPAEHDACHVVLASLSLMYAPDRAAAERGIAHVLSIDGPSVEVECPLSVRSRQ
jgi:hypothetical protein